MEFNVDIESLGDCHRTVRGRILPPGSKPSIDWEYVQMIEAVTNDTISLLVVEEPITAPNQEDVLRLHLERAEQMSSPGDLYLEDHLIIQVNDLVALTLLRIDDFVEDWARGESQGGLVLRWHSVLDCRSELAFHYAKLLYDTEDQLKHASQRIARRAAHARHATSAAGLAKTAVKELWLAWVQAPSRYPSAMAFARDMLDKYPDALKSEAVIVRWVREWKWGSLDG